MGNIGLGEAITATNFMTNCVNATQIPRTHNLVYGIFSIASGCFLGLLTFWTIIGCFLCCSFSVLGVWHLLLFFSKGTEGDDGGGDAGGYDGDGEYTGLISVCISCFNVPNLEREQNLTFAIVSVVLGCVTMVLTAWTIIGLIFPLFFFAMAGWHGFAYHRKGSMSF